MKNFIQKTIRFLLFLTIIFNLQTAFAQAPNKFSYQTVVRNASNTLLTNAPVGIKISILQTTSTGTTVYTETHTTTTNVNGLASVEIGGGTVVSGVFANINWANGPFFVKTETDPAGGTSYSIVGTTQLLSVPYALFAAKSADGAMAWKTTGNLGTDPAINFIGTTDNKDVVFKRGNVFAGRIGDNLAIGVNSLVAPTSSYNTAFGNASLQNITSGQFNVALGYQDLKSNTSGNFNLAAGAEALLANTTGSSNTSLGFRSLYNNTTGHSNIAIGNNTLESNISGIRNTAVGNFSLKLNTGRSNSALGYRALEANIVGVQNTAVGEESLLLSNSGDNTAVGYQSARANTTGIRNAAFGYQAMRSNTTGEYNVAIGAIAMDSKTTGNANTAVGYYAMGLLNTGGGNTAIGWAALSTQTSGINNTAVGFEAFVPNLTGSNQVRFGNTAVTYAGVQVAWTITSDRRWKTDIQKSNLGLDFIKQLNPVSYSRKNDESKKVEYGFIAQEIEESLTKFNASNTGIITKGDDGMYGVRYNDFIAPIVKAVQELDEKNKQLILENQELKTQINTILKRLDNLEK
jgi:trimeric autotransporter adhesin